MTDRFLSVLAKGAGVPNIARWDADRQSSRRDSVLFRTQAHARQLGFNGTPSIVVEGPGGKRPFAVS